MTVSPLAAESDTVKVALTVPLSPSVTVTLLTESVGWASSSVIVPTPIPSAIVTLDGFDRLSVNVSFASSSVSPWTRTVTCFVVSPAAKLSVPEVAA